MNKQTDKLSLSPLSAILPAAAFMIFGTVLAGVAAANGIYPQSDRLAVPETAQLSTGSYPKTSVSRVEPFNYMLATSSNVTTGSLNDHLFTKPQANSKTRRMGVISYQVRAGKVVSAELIQVAVGAESS